MGLKLDPESEAARDLAKRAVPAGGELDVGILLSALFHSSALKDQFPQLAPYLKKPVKRHKDTPGKVQLAEALRPVMTHLAALNDRPLTPAVWFRALLESEPGREFLISGGIDEQVVAAILAALDGEPKSREAEESEEFVSEWRESRERQEAIGELTSYGRMLTLSEPPHRGVVEMERPLNSLIKTLCRRKRRNAIVIGYPGTGKSALVYELARLLVRGDKSLPPRVRDCDIFELSPSFLRSGAGVVGLYDARVTSLIKVLRDCPKIILFVDEIHSLLQSGLHMRGPFTDANEAFKAALGLGEISCIGCTTTAEYRHYIEPDGALARRFSVIRLEPPSPKATLQILKARRPKVEEFYDGLPVPDEILQCVIDLTEQYLPSRFQPDKAIQLIDEACALCVTMETPPEAVSEDALWRALEDIIGHSIVREEQIGEDELFERLREKIVGQDEALRGIARAFVSGLGGWSKKSAPRGVFFFAGPTGVGKTETALLLSRVLGGGQESLVRIDCNTLQGSGYDPRGAISYLLGVEPGFVGYVQGKGGVLSRIRDKPESVVLFDEIEKADPGVGKLLLQIIDDGRVEDRDGNVLDFRRSFIIFTTNAGCVYDEKRLGFEAGAGATQPRTDMESLKAEIRAMGLGEEFLGRIGHYFEFSGLDGDSIRQVLASQLDRLRETADIRGYDLEWHDEIVEHLASQWQPRFGVRHLLAILRNRIVEQLSVAEAQGELKGIKTIRLEVLETDGAGDNRDLAGLATRERRKDTLVIKVA
jgi:ATP-dependent Clp protease ATP-binding subunit ClpA